LLRIDVLVRSIAINPPDRPNLANDHPASRPLMQTIHLIRHAKAEDRENWSGDDALRPLTKAGRKQAMMLAENYDELEITTIRSSPALRCVQTVQPLTERKKMNLTIDASLMEGSPITLPPPEVVGLHIIGAHGDNIPWLLDDLKIRWTECRKGSTWIVERDGKGRVLKSSYVPSP